MRKNLTMTVKCLNEVDQAYICDAYLSKTQTVTELAITYNRSRRTIIRVLEDAGYDPVKHRTPKVDIPLTFPNHPIFPGRIEMIDQPKPWYLKVLRYVGINA